MRKIILSILLMLTTSNLICAMTEQEKSNNQREIKNGWMFHQAESDKWYPAEVPGCVHTDLLNNHLIDDPFFGINEQKLQWIGEKNWTYQTEFDVESELLSKQNLSLIFKGLDTYADVFLNDSLILKAENMFREWKVECKNLLKPNGNILRLEFRNVFDENLPKWNNAPYRLMAFDNNDQAEIKINMYSRKAGFHFGWDWGPRLVTCGIWRPVILEAWDEIKLNDIFITQKNVSEKHADVFSTLEIFSDNDSKAIIRISLDGEVKSENKIELKKGLNKLDSSFEIENPKLWWTNGLGEQYLYKFKCEVITETGLSDERELKVGIRSIEVVREKDSIGTSFYFKINGVPVFAKGANYIPQDNFQNRITADRYRHIISSAADANMNILRVWGGGIYEEDIFYDLCDEYGILVWQEFMFACGMYPSDNAYLQNVQNEVTDNVRRIRNHPSLAIYCGNNENEIAWFQWGWKQLYSEDIQIQHEKDYHKLFYETIPAALKSVDTTRYYHPSSPSSSFKNFSYNDGDAHFWSVWHGKEPFEKFNDNIARFMSEYGFQSYPEMNSIDKFTKPEDRELHSDVMLSHQRCMSDARKDKEYGNRLIQAYMERQFKQPKDFKSYVYVTQVLQAEGVKMAIETHRRAMPKCMGTMYWQIDDCWPVASWSSIDYYGRWKALHYFTKKSYEPLILAPVFKNDNLYFFIVSDKLEPISADLRIRTMDFNGKELFSKSMPVKIEANGSKSYLELSKKELAGGESENKVVIVAQLVQGKELLNENIIYLQQPKDLSLEKPEIKMNVVKNDGGYEIELSTNKLAKNVFLSMDQDGFFSDNYFDLLPGVKKKVEIKTQSEIVDLKSKIEIVSLIDSYD